MPGQGYNSWLQSVWANRSSLDATQLLHAYAELRMSPNTSTIVARAQRRHTAAAMLQQRSRGAIRANFNQGPRFNVKTQILE